MVIHADKSDGSSLCSQRTLQARDSRLCQWLIAQLGYDNRARIEDMTLLNWLPS
jgi:hypothetical protein